MGRFNLDSDEKGNRKRGGEKVLSVLSSIIKRQVKKHGLTGFLLKIGDVAVKVTPNSGDDIVWRKIKLFILANRSKK
tara:strand:- start:646 stop:876 length:231 start_codon:yes stop_codon:yes gene_type:complete